MLNTTYEKEKFIENETIIYHNHYGEGVFKKFLNGNRIVIEFSDREERLFEYPSAFNEVLSLTKTSKMIQEEHKRMTPYYREQDEIEKKYFNSVKKVVDENLKNAISEEKEKKYEFNDFTEDFNPNLSNEYNQLMEKVSLLNAINNNPYFAKIEYFNKKENNQTIYIGKNNIPGYVVAWNNPICAMYYHYKYYTSVFTKNKIEIVRDFDIKLGRYFGFIDKYNKNSNKNDKSVIADERLLKVIKENKTLKKTHDIIASIQENQYSMIIYDYNKNILILGCAGSGKTMIMLHRLSYMALNENLNLQDTFLISPTNLLNLEVDELSKSLNINKAHKFSSIALNKKIIEKYYITNDVFFDIEKFKNSKIISNHELNEDIIKKIYSKEFINDYCQEIYKLINLNTVESQLFIEQKLEEITKKFSIQNINDKNIILNEYLFTIQEKEYNSYIDIISKIPLENIEEQIKSINKSIQTAEKNGKSPGKNKLKMSVLNFVLRENINNLLDRKHTKYNNQGDISKEETIFNDVYEYFNISSDDKYKESSVETVREKTKFIYIYNLFERERNLLREYKYNKNYRIYFDIIIENLIENIKTNNNIKLDTTYEFEIFLKAYANAEIFNNCINEKKYILIDEIQDYSIFEINMYKKVFLNSIFNFFGDINQSINPKGMSKDELLNIVDKNDIFSINENYRNAYDITKYINKRFKTKMLPIGIKGKVYRDTLERIINYIKINNEDRIAIIVKNKDIANKYLSNMENTNNLFYNDINIIREKINILSVNMSKGLEFEKVIVIEDNMTTNELYVSFTRALNELYIVKK